MRYQTKLLITAALLLAMSLSAAALAYWGVTRSHTYLTRSRIAHEQLERHLQLSRHSQQLFKAWTDTLLTGIAERPLGAAYLNKVIDSDLAALKELSEKELAIVGPEEQKAESAELERLTKIRQEFQHTLDQLGEVEQLQSRGRPDVAWQRLIDLLKGGIDQKLNELIEVGVADETAEVIRIDADAQRLLGRLERVSQIHAALAVLATLALVMLLLRGLRAPLAELLRGTGKLAEGDLSHRISISGRDEFADLGQSFNRMAGDLQAHQQALQETQQHERLQVRGEGDQHARNGEEDDRCRDHALASKHIGDNPGERCGQRHRQGRGRHDGADFRSANRKFLRQQRQDRLRCVEIDEGAPRGDGDGGGPRIEAHAMTGRLARES